MNIRAKYVRDNNGNIQIALNAKDSKGYLYQCGLLVPSTDGFEGINYFGGVYKKLADAKIVAGEWAKNFYGQQREGA